MNIAERDLNYFWVSADQRWMSLLRQPDSSQWCSLRSSKNSFSYFQTSMNSLKKRHFSRLKLPLRYRKPGRTDHFLIFQQIKTKLQNKFCAFLMFIWDNIAYNSKVEMRFSETNAFEIPFFLKSWFYNDTIFGVFLIETRHICLDYNKNSRFEKTFEIST